MILAPSNDVNRRPPILDSSRASKAYLDVTILYDRRHLPDASVQLKHFFHARGIVLDINIADGHLILAYLITGSLCIRSPSFPVDHNNSAHGSNPITQRVQAESQTIASKAPCSGAVISALSCLDGLLESTDSESG